MKNYASCDEKPLKLIWKVISWKEAEIWLGNGSISDEFELKFYLHWYTFLFSVKTFSQYTDIVVVSDCAVASCWFQCFDCSEVLSLIKVQMKIAIFHPKVTFSNFSRFPKFSDWKPIPSFLWKAFLSARYISIHHTSNVSARPQPSST